MIIFGVSIDHMRVFNGLLQYWKGIPFLLVFPFKSQSGHIVLQLRGLCDSGGGSEGVLACVFVALFIAGTPMGPCSLSTSRSGQ